MKNLNLRQLSALFSIFFIVCTGKAFAQVTVAINAPASWQFNYRDIWRASLMNTSGAELTVKLQGHISRLNGTTPLVQVTSTSLTLKPGLNTITPTSVATAGVTFSDNTSSLAQTGYLPYGSYALCIKVFAASDNTDLGENCIEYELNPMSPPILVSPFDGAEIYTPTPLLSWFPPAPVSAGNKIVYSLKLVEILQGETKADALIKNKALVDLSEINSTMLLYPATSLPLQKDKSYAWQVKAFSSGVFVGETEVWSFTLGKKAQQDTSAIIYAMLKLNPDGSFYTVRNNKLYFQFSERYIPGKLSYQIYDHMHREAGRTCKLQLDKKAGDNRFMLDFSRCPSMQSGYYLLEVTDERKTQHYLSFYIQE